VTAYQYDANDRLISTTYNDGKVVTNTYDDEDRLVGLNDTAPGAGQHNFAYDLLDRLTKESTPRGTVSYAYDVLGRRTSLKINNQRSLSYAYDDNDGLTAITEGNETFGFSYDQLDRRAGMTLPNGISTAYSYDAAGRLTGMKYSKGSTVLRDLVYGYDEINRRTSYSGNTAPAPRDTATDTATVNALNQYTTRNGKPIAHDDNANQTINNAVWDARDRLISLSGPNFTASFTYDAMGRRTSKTVNGQKKTYLYDGSDLISETGADYTFGPGIDEPLERKSGQNEYYLSDALGSVIGLADGTGTIKTSYNYSPFGKKQTTGVNSSNPFAFTGREDDGNGYYFYRARYYSPDQKRFISEDPLGFGGGDTNLQAYVGNSPINFTDPSGLRGIKLRQSRTLIYTDRLEYGANVVPLTNNNVDNSNKDRPIISKVPVNAQILYDQTTAHVAWEEGKAPKNKNRPEPPDKRLGDTKGHILGNGFGGSNTNLDNFFAQVGTDNEGSWKDYNDQIRDYLEATHKSFTLNVFLAYKGPGRRPTTYGAVAVFCDGKVFPFAPHLNGP
jgi:RHS repeat-associated protein